MDFLRAIVHARYHNSKLPSLGSICQYYADNNPANSSNHLNFQQMGRTQNAVIAEETVQILERGSYLNAASDRIELGNILDSCRQNTQLYLPAELEQIVNSTYPAQTPTQIEVTNETSLEAARRIVAKSERSVICLNFASANNPGGGFLNGSQAQEESLARASGLSASLLTQPEFYEFHRQQKNLLYSDRIIYSPNVPVFRDDAGNLLDRPYLLSFITSPAPNAGAIAKNTPQVSQDVANVLRMRAAKILALAASLGYDQIILGAWGCGVFRNSPERVAAAFKEQLDGRCKGKFDRVIFAVLDSSAERMIFNAFARSFA
jgi:uncharacterized protein (TIGR02452 family)